MTVQFIDIGGEKHAVMPIADYERLLADAEDRADARAAADAEERRSEGEEYLPSDMVDRLLAGDSALRVWRRHRGMTLERLAKSASLSTSHVSMLETAERQGTLKVWRRLSDALGVTVDDILPGRPN